MTPERPERERSLGHLALHYAPGDEQAARRLLADLGCTLVDNGPRPGDDGFCTVLLDGATANHADNVMFLARMSPAQLELEQSIRERFAVGTDSEAPSVAGFARLKRDAPEAATHAGIRYAGLDDLERAVLAVESDACDGGPLHGRVTVTKYRARPGLDPGVDERLRRSPVFTGDERPAYANYWVQCFVTTDLLAAGLLVFGQTFELDYVFEPFFDRPPAFG